MLGRRRGDRSLMRAANGTAETARLLTVGTVSSTPIQVDATHLFHTVPVYVTLTSGHPYVLANPPGWPARPHMTGKGHATTAATTTVAAGTRIALLQVEAAALVAAGAAVYS